MAAERSSRTRHLRDLDALEMAVRTIMSLRGFSGFYYAVIWRISSRTSRLYTISLLPELAQQAEALAKRSSRTMSELFGEAFRAYSAQQARRALEEIGEYAASRNPDNYTEADVPRVIAEVRGKNSRAKASHSRVAKACGRLSFSISMSGLLRAAPSAARTLSTNNKNQLP